MKTYQYEIEDVGSTPSEDREYLNHAGALGFRLVCIADQRMYLEKEADYIDLEDSNDSPPLNPLTSR